MSYPHKEIEHLLPPDPVSLTDGKYDIFSEHSVYNENALLKKLHSDTVNIAIVREPMSHLRSAFAFYNLNNKIYSLRRSSDPVADFLKKPMIYSTEYQSRALEVTRNRVAMEFGYNSDVHDLQKYLLYIESKFLVLVFEHLSESLIVMKRKLCWSMKDILHFQMRKKKYDHKPVMNKRLVNLHKAWSPLDYVFYDHFNKVMDRTISEQDKDFHK